MNVLGVDPASNKTGIAVVDYETRKLVHSETYEPRRSPEWKAMGNKVGDKPLTPTALEMFFTKLQIVAHKHDVAAMVVERVSITQNLDTVRKIAYVEAMALLLSSWEGIDCLHYTPQEARKLGIGEGLQKKEAVLAWVRDRYGALLPEDECEAVVLALAYEVV